MLERDKIVCFELPCHARQSRNYKAGPDDPFIIPVTMTVTPVNRPNYYRSTPEFIGYPFLVVIKREDATSVDSIYASIIERLSRWTSVDLYKWEEGQPDIRDIDGASTQAISLPSPNAGLMDINENGDVLANEVPLEEEDISDMKHIVQHDIEMEGVNISLQPVKVGPKPELFTLTVQPDRKEFGSHTMHAHYNRADLWAERQLVANEDEPWLLRADDFLVCEFDENIKQFYFDDSAGEVTALWNHWELFEHAEYLANKESCRNGQTQPLDLQDCLDAFTAREKLGEDGSICFSVRAQ